MRKVFVDFWYYKDLPGHFIGFEEALAGKVGAVRAGAIMRSPIRRCLAFYRMASGYDYVVPEWNRYGRAFSLLQALWPRGTGRDSGGRQRNVVIVECIDFANLHKATMRARLLKAAARGIIGPAMRRCVARVQMMTQWEMPVFAATYGLPVDRIACIPWPLHYSPQLAERVPEAQPPLWPCLLRLAHGVPGRADRWMAADRGVRGQGPGASGRP